ncbi:hypothetical protein ACPA9J_15235 [Pseudomonas aeruginosa]
MRGKAGYSHSKAPVICVPVAPAPGSHKCWLFDPGRTGPLDKGKLFKHEPAHRGRLAGGLLSHKPRADEKETSKCPARPVLQGRRGEGAGRTVATNPSPGAAGSHHPRSALP